MLQRARRLDAELAGALEASGEPTLGVVWGRPCQISQRGALFCVFFRVRRCPPIEPDSICVEISASQFFSNLFVGRFDVGSMSIESTQSSTLCNTFCPSPPGEAGAARTGGRRAEARTDPSPRQRPGGFDRTRMRSRKFMAGVYFLTLLFSEIRLVGRESAFGPFFTTV